MPARHTHLDNSRAKIISEQGLIVLAVGTGGGGFDNFLSSIISLFFLPLSGRRPDTY